MSSLFIKVVSSDPAATASPIHNELKAAIKKSAKDISIFFPDPIHIGKFHIEIVNTQNVKTNTRLIGTLASHVIQFGTDFIPNGFAKPLYELSIDTYDIATQVLGHETFHLGQLKRMQDHGFPAVWQNSGFAQGIDGCMSDPWVSVARVLAKTYQQRKNMLPLVQTAADMVSEIRADIRGLNAMKHAKLDYEKFAPILHSMRAEEEFAQTGKTHLSESFDQLLKRETLPTEADSIPFLWSSAINLLASMTHGKEVDDAIATAKNSVFVKPVSAPSATPRI